MKAKKSKVLVVLALALTLLMGANSLVLAEQVTAQTQKEVKGEDMELQKAYDDLIKYAEKNNIPLRMEYKQFAEEYKNTGYDNVKDYVDSYYRVLKPVKPPVNVNTFSTRSLSSIGNPFAWQYNTGLGLPKDPNYSKYNLLEVCKPGDIVYEANGGFGITGHIAMVEGKFYDEARDTYYIRVIEAIQNGVVRSVLDDDRMDLQKSYIYRVNGSDDAMRNRALEFEISQLGKPYWLDFGHKTSPDNKSWYCSELAWAAYKNQGVDIETQAFFQEPGVSPRDIVNSGMVTLINVNK